MSAGAPRGVALKIRRIGKTDLNCSIVGLGTGRLTSYSSSISRRSAIRLVHAAADIGINVIDTADIYGQGDSELVIGSSIRGRRDRFIVASKVGYRFARAGRLAGMLKPVLKPLVQRLQAARELAATMRQHAAVADSFRQDFSPKYITEAIDASLRRLQTDYLDILFLHDPPLSDVRSVDAMVALNRVRAAGKIRHIGLSTSDPAVLEWLAKCGRDVGVVQMPVNPESPSSLQSLSANLSAAGIGVVANHIFGSAALHSNPRLVEFGKRYNLSVRQVLIGLATRSPSIASALIGTTSEDHLRQNVEALAAVEKVSFDELAL